MLGKVFKAYDIRATYPKPLNEKMAWQIGCATAQYLIEQAEEAGHDDPMMRHIVVGRDMRQSSPSLCEMLVQGMRDFGAHVIDVGLVDTPFISFAINYLGCAGGVMTTASHNPANYNGFKIAKAHAKPVGMTTGLDDIRRYAAMVDRDKIQARGGRYEQRDLWEPYRDHVLAHVSPALLDGSKEVNVVIDASNGMAGTMVPRLFGNIPGLKIKKLNFDNSKGIFAHEPNPLVESNLDELRDQVVESKAEVGICFDGDADRCVLVDERGETVGCDIVTAWLAPRFLKKEKGAAIVYDLRSTKALPEIIKAAGGTPVRSRVGHVFMKEKMAEHNAIFGGELSGHFYFRDNFYADSGAIAFAVVMSALAEDGKPLSEALAPVQRYVQSGEINFEVEDKEVAIESLREAYDEGTMDELDGLTVDLGDWWFNVRSSNTEPLLRLNLEGKTEKQVDERVTEVSKHLGKRVAH
jgi:phosphomannomutase